MDEATLRRLGNHGLIGFPPDTSDGLTPGELSDLSNWCTSQGENTGSAAFMILGTAIALIAEPREEDEQVSPDHLLGSSMRLFVTTCRES